MRERRMRPGMRFAIPKPLSRFTMLPAVFVSSRDPDGDFESRSQTGCGFERGPSQIGQDL